jgi:cytochrome c oxidase subunit II
VKSIAVLSVAWLVGGWLLAVASEPSEVARAAADAMPVRRVEIVASRYAFEPAVVEARQGETVEIVARSKDTDHGIAIKALGVKLAIPKGGAAASATFVAEQAGRFPIECSEYCGSGHKRMKGELVVAEAAQ